MKSIGAVLVVLAAALVGCKEPTIQRSQEPQLVHPNGLQVPRPTGFEGTRTDGGFLLSEGGDIRSPRTIEIGLATDPPVLEHPRERALATGVIARYSIREMGAGSAGTEYELRAARAAGNRWIIVVAMAQSELGEPDFALAWRLLSLAR